MYQSHLFAIVSSLDLRRLRRPVDTYIGRKTPAEILAVKNGVGTCPDASDRHTEAMEQAFVSRLSVTEILLEVLEDFGTNLFETMHHPELGVLFRSIVADAAIA